MFGGDGAVENAKALALLALGQTDLGICLGKRIARLVEIALDLSEVTLQIGA